MKQKWACLHCGFVYDTYKTKRKRIDHGWSSAMGHTIQEFHGWEHFRICPNCKFPHSLGRTRDKNE